MKPIDEVVSACEAIERLKKTLRRAQGERDSGSIELNDGDIAGLFRISQSALSRLRTRNGDKIQIYVLKLCARTGLDPMKLLF